MTGHTVDVRCLVPAGLSSARLRHWASRWQQELGLPTGQLSVVIAGPTRMRQLNRARRGINRATDVLAFSWRQSRRRPAGERLVGEIFLCPAVIRQRAPQFERTYREHLLQLLQHGLIHLRGLDHRTRRQQQRWSRLERRLTLAPR